MFICVFRVPENPPLSWLDVENWEAELLLPSPPRGEFKKIGVDSSIHWIFLTWKLCFPKADRRYSYAVGQEHEGGDVDANIQLILDSYSRSSLHLKTFQGLIASIPVPKSLTGHFLPVYLSSSRQDKVEVTLVTSCHTHHQRTEIYFLHEERSYGYKTWWETFSKLFSESIEPIKSREFQMNLFCLWKWDVHLPVKRSVSLQ